MAKPTEVTDQTFEEKVLKAETPVMVDFWAPWCGPCRMVAPIVDQLSDEYDGKVTFLKLNTDENPKIATQYGIRSIPTLLVFKGGEVAGQQGLARGLPGGGVHLVEGGVSRGGRWPLGVAGPVTREGAVESAGSLGYTHALSLATGSPVPTPSDFEVPADRPHLKVWPRRLPRGGRCLPVEISGLYA